MKKEVKNILGDKNYLLGKRKSDGKKVWLQEESWDCGWYWGLGYIETYNHNYSDIEEHTHFDSLFLSHNIYHSFVEYFEETTLSDNETWELLELMQTLYHLKNHAEFVGRGSSYISTNIFKEDLQDKEQAKHINEVLIPKICERIHTILSDEEN